MEADYGGRVKEDQLPTLPALRTFGNIAAEYIATETKGEDFDPMDRDQVREAGKSNEWPCPMPQSRRLMAAGATFSGREGFVSSVRGTGRGLSDSGAPRRTPES
jgi:hypothetical protein